MDIKMEIEVRHWVKSLSRVGDYVENWYVAR